MNAEDERGNIHGVLDGVECILLRASHDESESVDFRSKDKADFLLQSVLFEDGFLETVEKFQSSTGELGRATVSS